jgi:ParB family transcriptional regulator, chromosome partitioning protein
MTAKTARKPAANAYAGLGTILGSSPLANLVQDAPQSYSVVSIAEITVKEQDRKEFEDEQNTLADFAADIKKRGVLQPILLRKMPEGYELVAGERRLRASKLAGLDRIPAVIRIMTDAEAEEAQFIENIERKNLTQIEEATRVQREIDALGSTDAFLAKYNKQRPWLSKLLGLLKLPEESRRLVSENISADLEVINTVRQVEKANPAAARDLVDTLKKGRGKVDARKTATTALKQVKPPKKAPATKSDASPATPAAAQAANANNFAPAKSGGTGTENFADAKIDGAPVFSPATALDTVYASLQQPGATVKKSLATLSEGDRADVGSWLYTFYDAGRHAMTAKGTRAELMASAVLQGLNSGEFATNGAGALALVAFMHGAEGSTEYDLTAVVKTALPRSK